MQRAGIYTILGMVLGVILVLSIQGLQQASRDAWIRTEAGEQLRMLLADVRSPVESADLAGTFKRYKETEILRARILEDPVKRLPGLGTTMEEVERIREQVAQRLEHELSECLEKGRFLSKPICYEEVFERGGSCNHYLDATDPYATVSEMEWIADDTQADYDLDLCHRAVVQYAAKEGPGLRKRWLEKEKGGWGDAAGCLWGFLTDDHVPPSKLGLSPSETSRLLENAWY